MTFILISFFYLLPPPTFQHGAKPWITNTSGFSAVFWATCSKAATVLEILQAQGSRMSSRYVGPACFQKFFLLLLPVICQTCSRANSHIRIHTLSTLIPLYYSDEEGLRNLETSRKTMMHDAAVQRLLRTEFTEWTEPWHCVDPQSAKADSTSLLDRMKDGIGEETRGYLFLFACLLPKFIISLL